MSKNSRILVVDDTEASRYTLSRLLRGDGYEVIEASTGREGLERARRETPDLVVLDVRLPDISGFEVAEQLRANEATRAVAILQVSATYTAADAQARGLRGGADAYLTQPLDSRVLSAAVHALLRMRQAERTAERERAHAEGQRARAEALLAEREHLVRELEAEAQRRDEFLAILSHELRNPLAPIQTGIDILERAAQDPERSARARAVIGRQVRHLTRLVDDLLDVTRIARGKVRLRCESVDLNELVRRVVEDHMEQFRRADLSLTLERAEHAVMVNGDAARLAQVLGNLLQNAAKFTPAQGRVAVCFRVDPRAGEARLQVKDSGVGIASDTLKRVFEPFVQADKTLERSGSGLGLGLALARGIIELHGGSISAESAGSGLGASFEVRLPLEQQADVRANYEPSVHQPVSVTRVLIIEDQLDAAESLRELLELGHHTVAVAHDGGAGVALAHAFNPDIVLCDLGLPVLNGYEVAQQLRASATLGAVFLVALSGYALPEDVERSRQAGFDRHLAKPPALDMMEQLFREAARSRLESRS
jgi:signal transduction histidine kinase